MQQKNSKEEHVTLKLDEIMNYLNVCVYTQLKQGA